MDFIDKFAEIIASQADLDINEIKKLIEIPPNSEMGDLAFPCFVFAKSLRKAPPIIAKELADKIKEDLPDIFSEIKNVGPYLNVFLKASIVAVSVLKEVQVLGRDYGKGDINSEQTVVVDFSSPNIAKPLGIHHLRSTMIGNSIAKIHSKLGYKVVRLNYLGDWGTQFGKLMVAYEKWKSEIEGELSTNELTKLYVKFTAEAEKDPSLDELARQWFKKLEDGDGDAVALWKKFKEISVEDFKKIYKRLGVAFDVYSGESCHSESISAVIKECLDKNISRISDGAVVVDSIDESDPPCLLQKSDGATTYESRDVAAVIDRHKAHQFHKMFWVVAQDQALHFKLVKNVLNKLGRGFSEHCEHTPFGLLRFNDAKLSTRKGNMILLDDVLDTAVTKIRELIAARENSENISEETIEQIGIGAIVFGDLSTRRIKNVEFIWDEMLNFDGDTGPYLQYTVARSKSIINKSNDDFKVLANFQLLVQDAEKAVLLKVNQFNSVIVSAAQNCEPSLIANYLLDLAKLSNRFIHGGREDTTKRVLQPENIPLQSARTALVESVAIVMEEGLNLLGIHCPERM